MKSSYDDINSTKTDTRSLFTSVALLKWGIAAGAVFKVDRNTLSAAVAAGNVEVLEHLKTEHGAVFDRAEFCTTAARYGHLNVLQWLRANCCTWNYMTCAFAAIGEHLEVLQWCRDEGCDCDWRCICIWGADILTSSVLMPDIVRLQLEMESTRIDANKMD